MARARSGTPEAVDRLFRATYQELRGLARQRLRRHSGITVLDTTVLVHECYLRLASLEELPNEDRAFFLHYAAKAMRSIVIDLLRARSADRHGGDAAHISLNTSINDQAPAGAADILRVNDALEALASVDARLMQVVEMKYFGGLTFQEIADCLGVTERTVRRDWQKARILLHTELAD